MPSHHTSNCTIEGCSRDHYGHGMCEMHYARWKRHGDPLIPGLIVGNHPLRFWSKVVFTPTCWLWAGPRTGLNKYGQFTIGANDKKLAHRWAYEFCVGPIPEGLQIDHLCRVTLCVNPDHLEPVTPQINTLRSEGPSAINSRKTVCINGHPLTGRNLHVGPNGTRICRECKRLTQRRLHSH